MSSIPLVEGAHTSAAGPVDTFVLRPNHQPPSILDTVFVSKRRKRAVYATTTDADHKTCLWRVELDGQLELVANIEWEYSGQTIEAVGDQYLSNSGGQVKNIVMVNHGGQSMEASEFLRKERGWFHSDSKVFNVDRIEYKWKSGNGSVKPNEGITNPQSAFIHTTWNVWRCVAASPTTPTTQPLQITARANSGLHRHFGNGPSLQLPLPHLIAESNAEIEQRSRGEPLEQFGATRDTPKARNIISSLLSSPSPSTLLARFTPPQLGLVHHELALYPPVFAPIPDSWSNPSGSGVGNETQKVLLESLLVSAILLVTNKGEWRRVKSLAGPDALQPVFVAEVRGDLPPYTLRVGRI